MQCYECGGHCEERMGPYSFYDNIVGQVSIQNAKYYKCANCGNTLLSLELSKKLDQVISMKKDELINSLPVRDFITGKNAADILGISRQAFHKNHRIKKGFIHQTKMGDNLVYVKRSVVQFLNTGDGRYPLAGNDKSDLETEMFTASSLHSVV